MLPVLSRTAVNGIQPHVLVIYVCLPVLVNSVFFWELDETPRGPGARQYKEYVVDHINGFLRPVAGELSPSDKRKPHVERPVGLPHDFTQFEAMPYSLEQFIRSYGHALLDSAWDINEISPVVHVHTVWTGETNRPISLPCWAPAQPLRIEFDQTTFRGHKRTWLIGQGNTLSLSLASAFGYKTDPASEALFISPFMGLQSGHGVFTCLLSRETPIGEKARPRVSFTQTHMLYYQTEEQSLQTARGKVEVELELSAYTPESHGPPCQLYPSEWDTVECRESTWQQIRTMDVRSNNSGYRYHSNKRLMYDGKKELKKELTDKAKDFCRIFSCTSEVSTKLFKPTYRNETITEVLHFFGDKIKHPNQSIIVSKPVWEKPTDMNTRSTHKLPGNSLLKVRIRMKFTNGMVNCHMVQRLFEPDMGDLQQTAHFMALDEEPYNPLSRMMSIYDLTWVRERYTPDAIKYRASFCADETLNQDSFDTVDTPAYNGSAGYTVLFNMPSGAGEMQAEVQFADETGSADCEVGIICSVGKCTLQISQDNEILSMAIPDYPEKGLYKPMKEPGHPDRFIFILIVGPPETYGEQLIQHLIILRNFIRVADGALILNPYKLPKACGGSATTRISEKSWIKIFNWPVYELIGPSIMRAQEAYNRTILPCNQSFGGVPYSASGQPLPLDIYPNNERRIYFATSGALCSDECGPVISRDSSQDLTLKCTTGLEKEPCMKQYHVSITRENYDLTQHATSWQYAAFAVQFCSSDYERIKEDSAYSIASSEAMACYVSGQIKSLSHTLYCQLQQSMDDLKGDLRRRCTLRPKDEALIHRYPVDATRLRLVPVVRKCQPKMDPPKLFETYQRGPNYHVQRLTYIERTCPIGYRRIQSFDGDMCIRCPPDSYADLDTGLTSCQGCPLSRPSTYSGGASSSAQCSNDQLNKLRGLFFRYDMSDLSDDEWDQSFNLSSQMWWNRNYTELNSLDHLKPEEKYLEQQRQAVALFKSMTQLTFSNTEVFLMLIISTALAVFGGVNFILLLAATSRSTKCPVSDFYGPKLNWKERIGLAIFCALCKIALMIQSIVLRMRYRFSHEYMRLRRSMKSSRLSVATSNFSRKMSNMLKNSYRQTALPPLTEGQKTLIRLLTKTTIDRIVEAAERDMEVKREQRRVLMEENRRRLHEAGEVEAEAHEAELAAEAAKREAEAAALQVADAKDGKAKTVATQKAEQAEVQAKVLAQRAASLREFATKRMSVMRDMMSEREKLEDDTADMPWLSMSDRKALHNAAPELRAYLQLPRYHTPEFFLLHPEMQHQAELRTTVHPAPDRDSRQEG